MNASRSLKAEIRLVSIVDVHPVLHVVTFATPTYVRVANDVLQSAKDTTKSFIETRIYSMDDVDEDFKTRNRDILSAWRGAGYWLWKPYIILKHLESLKDGETLVYIDSQYLSVADMVKFLPLGQELGCYIRKAGEPHFKEAKYTKMDAYLLMNVTRDPSVIQPWAGFIMIKKTNRTMTFMKEWLRYGQDPRIITDQLSTLAVEPAGFKENRHDQTIYGLLLRKMEFKCRDLPRQLIYNLRTRAS